MEIEVFKHVSNFTFKSVAQIDGFESLRNTRFYYKKDQFVLVVSSSKNHVEWLVPETVLLIGNTFYYVDKAISSGEQGEKLTVSGKSLIGKTDKRIIWRTYSKTARPETICFEHLTNEVTNPSDTKRKINYLTVDSPMNLTGLSIQYQNSYGNVMEQIESLCETYDFGFYETATNFENPQNKIIFFKGDDLSNTVEFTIDDETLETENYENSNDDHSSTAIVYGEGEGAARKSVVINPSLTGLERKEIYVDARDLQQETDGVKMPDNQYIEALKGRGVKSLAEQQAILRLDGNINIHSKLFIFNRDYSIGDKIRITSKRFNVSKVATLIGVEEVWDEKGHQLSPIWDKETTTLIDKIKRK